MSDWKDDLEQMLKEYLDLLLNGYYGTKNRSNAILRISNIIKKLESLLSKQREELVEKVEKIDFKQGYTEESQPIFEHGQIEARDQVIALIKDTNEVVEEEEKNK